MDNTNIEEVKANPYYKTAFNAVTRWTLAQDWYNWNFDIVWQKIKTQYIDRGILLDDVAETLTFNTMLYVVDEGAKW